MYRFLHIWLVPALILICMNGMLAQEQQTYSISSIPPQLTKGANAVIRNSNITLFRESINNATYKVSQTVSILNKKGLEYNSLQIPYDKFSRVKKIKLVVYDKHGKKVKRLKNEDIHDLSYTKGSVFTDIRFKHIDAGYKAYPFTIEYSYEISYEGYLSLPSWQLFPDYNVSVQHAQFNVVSSGKYLLRYYNQHIEHGPATSVDGNTVTYSWEINSAKALKHESLSQPLSKISPAVFIAPTQFIMDGYHGDFRTWNSFGLWIYKLNENRDQLTDKEKTTINSLVKDIESDCSKVDVLYKYMQSKTRYVSIQIGIGGWQPFRASYVEENSYGDCKALTNYMYAILKEAGIESHYTIVKAGKENIPMLKDFPYNQFNHAILCVPNGNDTIWLECTSNRNPTGYIGTFTDDRDVLLITENGGKLAHTRAYSIDENYQKTTAHVIMQTNGNANVIYHSERSGLYFDEINWLNDISEENRQDELYKLIHFPSYTLNSYALEETKHTVPSIHLSLDVAVTKYANNMNGRLIIPLHLANKHDFALKKRTKRHSDIIIKRSFQEIDSIQYMLPNDFMLGHIPEKTVIESIFGKYISEVIVYANCFVYVRKLELFKGEYSTSHFSAFSNFINLIEKSDKKKLVLKHNSLAE